MRKIAHQQEYNRRLAALVCLAALLLLNAISIAHTHSGNPPISRHVGFAAAPEPDGCVACDILANGRSSTTITPVYTPAECRSVAFRIHSTVCTLPFATLLTSSPRAPPAA